MIKNIVFDIGNVLMSFHPNEYFTEVFQDEKRAKLICTKLFSHEAWLKYDQGIYVLDDLYKVYNSAYPNDIEDINIVLKNWLYLLQPIHASIAFMKQMKNEGYQVYVLSNISEDSKEYVKQHSEVFTYAQGAVLSYEEKINKPDARIYEILLQRYDLNADETIFIDDSKANIEQANALGIYGIQYKNDEQMKRDVDSIIRRNQKC